MFFTPNKNIRILKNSCELWSKLLRIAFFFDCPVPWTTDQQCASSGSSDSLSETTHHSTITENCILLKRCSHSSHPPAPRPTPNNPPHPIPSVPDIRIHRPAGCCWWHPWAILCRTIQDWPPTHTRTRDNWRSWRWRGTIMGGLGQARWVGLVLLCLHRGIPLGGASGVGGNVINNMVTVWPFPSDKLPRATRGEGGQNEKGRPPTFGRHLTYPQGGAQLKRHAPTHRLTYTKGNIQGKNSPAPLGPGIRPLRPSPPCPRPRAPSHVLGDAGGGLSRGGGGGGAKGWHTGALHAPHLRLVTGGVQRPAAIGSVHTNRAGGPGVLGDGAGRAPLKKKKIDTEKDRKRARTHTWYCWPTIIALNTGRYRHCALQPPATSPTPCVIHAPFFTLCTASAGTRATLPPPPPPPPLH